MPSIIAEYLIELSKRTSASGTYAYRGQENADWGVESAAYRRLKNMGESFAEEWFINYHEKMIIEPARMNGYGFKNGRKVSDLELLAELQHYGAATCLIDFTRDLLVALWFACRAYKGEEKTEQDGKVFVLNINDAQIFSSLEQDDMECGIEAILNFRTRDKGSEEATLRAQKPPYWYWSPHGMNQRILKQNSLFVFGKSKIADDHIIGKIQIQKQDKEKVLKELKILGITRESLFKDMPGFASSHSHNVPAAPRHNPAVHYYSAGNEALQKGKPEKAKYLYSEAIEHSSDPLEEYYTINAYYNRGLAEFSLRDYKAAIADYSEVIKRQSSASAYYNRGLAKYTLNDLEGAEADCLKAIEEESDFTSAYYVLGGIYTKQNNMQEARKFFLRTKELAEKSNENELLKSAKDILSRLDNSDGQG